ncbi:class I SAM-dependent methyltransferase [bacterium]|nr:class I SAM-dependent methyltransferase [bacterium]
MNRQNYLELVDKYDFMVESLERIVRSVSVGSEFEGNCFYRHTTFEKMPELINKQVNIMNAATPASDILEIGFNAGHSCLLMLLANPTSRITTIDICEHPYTDKCYSYLQLMFPGRLTLLEGNSRSILSVSIPNEPFDLIHIDGAHDYQSANLDFYQSILKGRKNARIIFDDTQIPHIRMLWDGYIRDKLIVEETHYLPATHAIGLLQN